MQAYSFTELFNTEELAKNLASYQSSIDPLSAIHLNISENQKIFILNFGSIVFFNIPVKKQKYINDIINTNIRHNAGDRLHSNYRRRKIQLNLIEFISINSLSIEPR